MPLPPWADFVAFVQAYEPFPFEWMEGSGGEAVNYVVKIQSRLYAMLRALDGHLTSGARLCDLGAWPGTFLHVLRELHPDLDLRLAAAGLHAPPEYRKTLAEHAIDVVDVNLDPVHDGLSVGTDDGSYNLPEGSAFDVVVASEILEHMVNPMHLIEVARRALVPGGVLLLTTPNLGWVRHRYQLLLGRSPNPPLSQGILLAGTHDWRPHVRLYTMAEVRAMLGACGFRLLHEGFVDDTAGKGWSLKSILYSISSFRHSLLAVARKESLPPWHHGEEGHRHPCE